MRHRIGLVVGFLAAAGTLAVALAAASLTATNPALASSVGSVPTSPRVQVDTIYVPAPATPPTITVQRVITSGGEQEGGGDD